MRAAVYDAYGPPSRLRIAQIPAPTPRAGQVLIEVVATSINLSDWEGLHGSPAYARIGGLLAPRRHVLGSDIAGRVVAVAPDVSSFRVGDEVYGDNLQLMGGFAEYAVAPASALVLKPRELTFVEASTIPQSGAIALQAVARGRTGERMLLNGAGGGAGSFAIQVAKAAGLHVTGVDNAAKLDFMRELGADAVLDYRTQDFTRTGPYDLVIDLVAHRSVFALRRALARGGRYFMVGGTARTMARLLTVGTVVGAVTRTRLGILFVREGPAHFTPLADSILAGDIRVHVDRVFPLEEIRDALAYHGEGHALGKVVVQLRDE
ncbi:NAD(P)-dependent alcohol dehydrogenase [Microbacterium sp. BK668]|uniref:NAD(P)-dependent alcohol dehydrogenase n=1 Tax=Microbacterium sp. BK668 TaxID=2512118 RepID=UPI00105D189F|nr:NAD(P)-dependent alcohol dehydrogenase [Microbacterium sp. BK668]TDN92208.1 NADPH:quinone reductase-like Zn-dependent oxidoreductase [Microbacterium sp. BK668]